MNRVSYLHHIGHHSDSTRVAAVDYRTGLFPSRREKNFYKYVFFAYPHLIRLYFKTNFGCPLACPLCDRKTVPPIIRRPLAINNNLLIAPIRTQMGA
jgi:hypothetical protein